MVEEVYEYKHGLQLSTLYSYEQAAIVLGSTIQVLVQVTPHVLYCKLCLHVDGDSIAPPARSVSTHTPDLCSIGKLHLVRQALSRNAHEPCQCSTMSRAFTELALVTYYRVLMLARNTKNLPAYSPRFVRMAAAGCKISVLYRQKQVYPPVSCVDGLFQVSLLEPFRQGPWPVWTLEMLAGARGTKIKNCLALSIHAGQRGEKWSTGGRYGAVDDSRTLSCSLPGTGPFFFLCS